MKTSTFKLFNEAVANGDKNDPVWWAGYLWIDLTKKQADKVKESLAANTAVSMVYNAAGERWYKTPSGLQIKA